MTACPDDSTLFALFDEDTASDAVRAHVARCERCGGKLEELRGLAGALRAERDRAPSDVAWLGPRLAAAEAPSRPAPSAWRRAGAVTAVTSAIAVAAAFLVAPRLTSSNGGAFTARGAASTITHGPHRYVTLDIDLVRATDQGGDVLTPLGGGGVSTSTSPHFLLSYATTGAKVNTYLLSFAVDARGEVHWLYPAYETADEDPASVALTPGTPLKPMSTEAWFEALPAGRLEVYAVLTDAPLRVSDVERLSAVDRTPTALVHHFANADVRSWSLTLTP